MEINQYSIHWISLDPTTGSEINKTRPCVVLSPNEMNPYLKTIIIAPITSTLKPYPTRVICDVKGKQGAIMLDQIRTLDRSRILALIDQLSRKEITEVKHIINLMLC